MAAAVKIEPYVEENERRWYRSYITLLGVNEPMNMFQKERQIAFADRFRKTNDATTKLQNAKWRLMAAAGKIEPYVDEN